MADNSQNLTPRPNANRPLPTPPTPPTLPRGPRNTTPGGIAVATPRSNSSAAFSPPQTTPAATPNAPAIPTNNSVTNASVPNSSQINKRPVLGRFSTISTAPPRRLPPGVPTTPRDTSTNNTQIADNLASPTQNPRSQSQTSPGGLTLPTLSLFHLQSQSPLFATSNTVAPPAPSDVPVPHDLPPPSPMSPRGIALPSSPRSFIVQQKTPTSRSAPDKTQQEIFAEIEAWSDPNTAQSKISAQKHGFTSQQIVDFIKYKLERNNQKIFDVKTVMRMATDPEARVFKKYLQEICGKYIQEKVIKSLLTKIDKIETTSDNFSEQMTAFGVPAFSAMHCEQLSSDVANNYIEALRDMPSELYEFLFLYTNEIKIFLNEKKTKESQVNECLQNSLHMGFSYVLNGAIDHALALLRPQIDKQQDTSIKYKKDKISYLAVKAGTLNAINLILLKILIPDAEEKKLNDNSSILLTATAMKKLNAEWAPRLQQGIQIQIRKIEKELEKRLQEEQKLLALQDSFFGSPSVTSNLFDSKDNKKLPETKEHKKSANVIRRVNTVRQNAAPRRGHVRNFSDTGRIPSKQLSESVKKMLNTILANLPKNHVYHQLVQAEQKEIRRSLSAQIKIELQQKKQCPAINVIKAWLEQAIQNDFGTLNSRKLLSPVLANAYQIFAEDEKKIELLQNFVKSSQETLHLDQDDPIFVNLTQQVISHIAEKSALLSDNDLQTAYVQAVADFVYPQPKFSKSNYQELSELNKTLNSRFIKGLADYIRKHFAKTYPNGQQLTGFIEIFKQSLKSEREEAKKNRQTTSSPSIQNNSTKVTGELATTDNHPKSPRNNKVNPKAIQISSLTQSKKTKVPDSSIIKSSSNERLEDELESMRADIEELLGKITTEPPLLQWGDKTVAAELNPLTAEFAVNTNSSRGVSENTADKNSSNSNEENQASKRDSDVVNLNTQPNNANQDSTEIQQIFAEMPVNHDESLEDILGQLTNT